MERENRLYIYWAMVTIIDDYYHGTELYEQWLADINGYGINSEVVNGT